MASNTASSPNGCGILEQLEDHIKFKTSVIRGLLDLRSKEPNEKFKAVFEDVFRTLSEVDELVDTLTDRVEREKSFIKYTNSILTANESQVSKLKKLSEIIEERAQKVPEPSHARAPEPPGPETQETKGKDNTTLTKVNRTHIYRTFKGPKQSAFRGRIGMPDKYRIPAKK